MSKPLSHTHWVCPLSKSEQKCYKKVIDLLQIFPRGSKHHQFEALAAQSHHFSTGFATYLNYLTTATTGTAHVELSSSLSLLFSYSLSSSPFIFSLFQRYLRIKILRSLAFNATSESKPHIQIPITPPPSPSSDLKHKKSVSIRRYSSSVQPSKWLHPPFSAVRTFDGKIFAHGSQDDKSIAIQYLEAIRNLRNQDFIPVRTVHISYVPNEEIGGFDGAAKSVQSKEFKELNVGFMMDEGQASPGDEFRGLNYVAALLLLVMKTEEDAFWMLAVLLENVLVSDCYTTNLSRCHVEQRVFKDLLTKKCPRIAAHLEALDFDVSLVTTEWFLCLFSKSLPSELSKPEILATTTDARFMRQMRIPVLGFSPMINTPILLHDHNEFLSDSVFIRGIKVYESLISALSSFQEDVSSQ
ncbi:TBC1 domain family member 2A [Cucumis melo var. makuwa]|uniref:TBC1 domain family member 2A n=1 Tax=Cucumis melo var. makuwa TaxID=1194695 RepID=A0A5D3C5S0_CUCMM|nr:TBC1 domain family member 2A [Cucumis melo var. makuwa]TYK07241.1 TBC1 domain family member 2A [Cucumis melo var. makuwa]